MVDPDLISPIQADRITTPDVLRIQLGDMHVLDDNVLGPVGQTKPLASKNASTSNPDDGLVRSNRQALDPGLVVRALGLGIRPAPIRTASVDGILARLAARIRLGNAAFAVGASVLRPDEIELLVDEDHTRRVIAQPGFQFRQILGCSRTGITSTGGATSKAKCCALYACCSSVCAEQSRCDEKRAKNHIQLGVGETKDYSNPGNRKRKKKTDEFNCWSRKGTQSGALLIYPDCVTRHINLERTAAESNIHACRM